MASSVMIIEQRMSPKMARKHIIKLAATFLTVFLSATKGAYLRNNSSATQRGADTSGSNTCPEVGQRQQALKSTKQRTFRQLIMKVQKLHGRALSVTIAMTVALGRKVQC